MTQEQLIHQLLVDREFKRQDRKHYRNLYDNCLRRGSTVNNNDHCRELLCRSITAQERVERLEAQLEALGWVKPVHKACSEPAPMMTGAI
jgi:hypothetical protein